MASVTPNIVVFLGILAFSLAQQFTANNCPAAAKYGKGPPASCTGPKDPLNKPASAIEQWLTRDVFYDLFPKANLGWGPNKCFPYSYEAFTIAARYFPGFGTSSPSNGLSSKENTRRDVAAFFAHAVQETGENDGSLYTGRTAEEASNCFYRGGFFNWFEGGPTSSFLPQSSPGYSPQDGDKCISAGRYCSDTPDISYFYPCGNGTSGQYNTACYFGRGAIQISYNYNYGQFQEWLASQGIKVDLINNPNLVMTKMDPPLAILASLWFFMTPQPPKPAMHDIILGQWKAGSTNEAAGYKGPILGPTSLVINNECNGEDASNPGGAGESRRIKAFKWFCGYFGVNPGDAKTLTCKDMPEKFDAMRYNLSYQPDWSATWKNEPCTCAPAGYSGLIPYFDPAYYPKDFAALNAANKKKCEESVYAAPQIYSLDAKTSACLSHPPK